MKNKPKFRPDQKLKLMDQTRQVLRYHHYAYRTEETYCNWIIRFLKFYDYKIHPRDMGKNHIETYLSHLAVKQNVAAATQRQALNAILFLFREVLDISIEEEIAPIKAKKYPRPPVVMTQSEVARVFNEMKGTHLLMARLLYGGGLRLMECVRLRVQNLDFAKKQIYVRGAKGGKDRVTILPGTIREDLQNHLLYVKQLHEDDLVEGYGEVYLPHALERKYSNAAKEWGWQYVFPAKKLGKDPRSGKLRRHHVLESGLQKAVKLAVQQAGISKRVSCHTFRHCFATHLLENGVNIRVVQKLMGHTDVKTTEIYTHVMEKNISAVLSPLDQLVRSIVNS